MTLEIFSQLIQPPSKPIENDNLGEWDKVETALKIELPKDYKDYINIFGTGCIANLIWVFNPFSKNPHLNLQIQIKEQLEAIAVLQEQFNENCPYKIYPEKGGLLPWGLTDNGDVMFWLTDGEPDFWKTVIHESRGSKYEKHEDTMTSFLSNLILGITVSEIITNDLIDSDAKFKVVA